MSVDTVDWIRQTTVTEEIPAAASGDVSKISAIDAPFSGSAFGMGSGVGQITVQTEAIPAGEVWRFDFISWQCKGAANALTSFHLRGGSGYGVPNIEFFEIYNTTSNTMYKLSFNPILWSGQYIMSECPSTGGCYYILRYWGIKILV